MSLPITPSPDNVFFFWGGDPAGRLAQINLAIASFRRHNPDKPLFLFSNDLELADLDQAARRDRGFRLLRWTPHTLVEGTEFAARAGELDPDFIAARHDGDMSTWIMFSDFFRYLVLWRFGGSYVDLDDVSVRPLPAGRNLVPATLPVRHEVEDGFGALAPRRDDHGAHGHQYLRLGTDPLVRFTPGNAFLRRCLAHALARPPALAGARVMTETYAAMPRCPDITLGANIDMILHPGAGLPGWVAARLGWESAWWWSMLSTAAFAERWQALFRLGTFCVVKNHEWRWQGETSTPALLASHACVAECRARVSMPADRVSVIIPAHRPRFLADTLAALAAQHDRRFEVIVVMNGPRDEAVAALVARHADALDVVLHHEPRLGLNIARNAGAERARGGILAFLDDDCEPAPGWLGAVRARFREDPATAVIGGRVRLKFRRPPPPWLAGPFRALLSELDPSPGSVPESALVGANFAVSRAAFDLVGGFDEAIGMRGRSGPQLCNDEIAFCLRLARAGGRAPCFVPAMSVDHQVGPERCSIGYFLGRQHGQGLSDARLLLEHGRRLYPEVLEKLERHLYDPGGWPDLASADADLDGGDAGLADEHAARLRIAYLAGLAEGCLEAMDDARLRAACQRYARAGERLLARWQHQGAGAAQVLRTLVRWQRHVSARKRHRHHAEIRPQAMLGRVALLRAASPPTDSTAAIAVAQAGGSR